LESQKICHLFTIFYTNRLYTPFTMNEEYFLTLKSGPHAKEKRSSLLAVLKPNRIIHKRTDANCSSFHLRLFLGLSNPEGQRQTSTISIPHDNFVERKSMFNLETSRTTQIQLYKCIHGITTIRMARGTTCIDNASDTSSTTLSKIFRPIKAVNLQGIK
jgi:hypothetical protein